MLIGLLAVSIILQISAAFFALRLVGPSRGRRAWIIIALAFFLRAARLIYQSFLYLNPKFPYQLVFLDELLGLAVSAALLLGVWWIRPLFEAFRRAEVERELYAHSISHDLRAPLTVVQGYAEILQARLPEKPTDPAIPAAVQAILHSTTRMDAMIGDLVDAAKSEGQQLSLALEPLKTDEFLQEVIARALPVSERHRVRLDIASSLPPVMADRERVERVLINLLTNALKFSPPETPVLIRGAQRGERVAISVTDIGPGIAPAELPHIFERFYRSQASRKKEGLGLGLYISRLFIEAHGGRIWAENNAPERGCTFTFTLPKAVRSPR